MAASVCWLDVRSLELCGAVRAAAKPAKASGAARAVAYARERARGSGGCGAG
jgi:hypothetical protein